MNKRGQVLVFFIIFIPILLGIVAFTVDMGYSLSESNKLNGINKMVTEYGLINIDKADIKQKMIDLIYSNDSNIDTFDLDIVNNEIFLNIKKSVDSIFGKVINIDFYNLSSTYKGYIKNGKRIIEKG